VLSTRLSVTAEAEASPTTEEPRQPEKASTE